LYVGNTTETRLPRHDIAVRLSAEHPREALARDEALLSAVQTDRQIAVRWYTAATPAIVVGLGLRHRLPAIVDLERCRAASLDVLERRAGGGAVLLDEHMLCGAICVPLPHPLVTDDLTESYRWLGERVATRLQALGEPFARRVEVPEARADIATLRAAAEPVSKLLLATCYGALSPHEVVLGNGRKVVGFAQVRRRHAALFQLGILQRDQSGLADFLRVDEDATRERLRAALRGRTVGLAQSSLEQLALLFQADQFA
jgi:lipoate---protein ligase